MMILISPLVSAIRRQYIATSHDHDGFPPISGIAISCLFQINPAFLNTWSNIQSLRREVRLAVLSGEQS